MAGAAFCYDNPPPMLQPGDSAPDFEVETDGGGTLRLADFRGQKVVLYFYPKDSTPGCTIEALAFRDAEPEFGAKNAVILGVSADSVRSHDRFKARCNLPFRLLSDRDHAIAEAYGAWREKRLFGKKYMGIVRSTYVIDEQGRIEATCDKVKVRGHAADLLRRL